MRTIGCLCIALLLLASCQKEQEDLPKMLSFNDASNKYSVTYEGKLVTEINVDSGLGAPYTIASYTYQNNYIRADLHPNTGYSRIDYFMKNNTLPSSIRKYALINGSDTLVSRVDFYYNASSGALDSTVLQQNTEHLTFIPVYGARNITDYYIRTNNGPPVLSGNFLYYASGNVFKSTNPLLFIYSNPVFQFEAFMLPRLYSANTLKKFNGGSFVYDTDSKGNLSLEDYGAIYPYKRTYVYR